MLRLYRETAALAFRRAVKAWPVAFSLLLYAGVLFVAAPVVVSMGMLGGLLLGLVLAACLASYLHLLFQAVTGGELHFRDIKDGVASRFWDVVSVMFALWLISMASAVVVGGAGSGGRAIAAMIGIALAFFLNPAPELLSLGRVRSFALLMESARFVLANPVAWFLPNIVFAVLLLAPTNALAVSQPAELLLIFGSVFSVAGLEAIFRSVPPWDIPVALLLLHYAMVFRGLLFQELSSGSARQRAYRARGGTPGR